MSSETPTVPLSRFRALLAGPRGQRKLDALLSAEDAEAAVAALPVTELHQLIDDVGLADSVELLALATPEQIRGCLDIEVWDRDELQLEAVKPWLQALVETGFEKLAQVWEQLDPELTALVLQRFTHIYDLTLDEEPDDSDGRSIVTTPDTFFAIKICTDDDDTIALVHRLLEDLYRADASGQLARHTIMAARSEPPAELEEMSYRWRSARMADLGYADFHEALEVFRPLEPESVVIGEGTQDQVVLPGKDSAESAASVGVMPASMAEAVVGRSFLARALDRISERDELERLEMALVVLVNKVLSAARVSPGKQEALKVGAEHTSATVSLGLEAVSKGDLERAATALRTISLTRLHRAGYTLTLRLARMARALGPRAATAGEPDASVLAALGGRRPWFARALDSEPGTGIRPFESMDDIRRVAEALTRLALRIAVADSLGVDLVALASQPEPRPELDDHVRTALVRAVSGGVFEAAPLSLTELDRFRRTALSGGKLTASARETAAAALLARLDAAKVTAGRQLLPGLLDRWLADLEDSLGRLPEGSRPDPRFIGGILLATAQA